jgi:hypothetical protein
MAGRKGTWHLFSQVAIIARFWAAPEATRKTYLARLLSRYYMSNVIHHEGTVDSFGESGQLCRNQRGLTRTCSRRSEA